VSQNNTGSALNDTQRREARNGLVYGLSAYALWGVFPLYFHALSHVSSWVIVCHRVLWSVIFLAGLISLRREWPALTAGALRPRALIWLALSGVLIAVNWLVFIYAVTTGRVLESSLGYFINPLFSVALGLIFLKERLRGLQWLAVLAATAAVVNLVVRSGQVPWIAPALAGSFGLYGLVRKKVDVNSLHALLVETALLLPLALAGLAWLPATPAGGHSPAITFGLLAFTGVITAVPLLCFGAALRRLKLSTMGFLQYVGPTLQFLMAVGVLGEPLNPVKLSSFILCWIAIAVYVADSIWARTAQPVADRPE
jgi:chloramphenicol-sensitive protein RarD